MHLAVLHWLSVDAVHESLNAYLRHGLLEEAVALGSVRLLPADPTLQVSLAGVESIWKLTALLHLYSQMSSQPIKRQTLQYKHDLHVGRSLPVAAVSRPHPWMNYSAGAQLGL